MARKIKEVWYLDATFVAVTALHVGGRGADARADLAFARNGAGICYVPGTSLAGVVRSHLHQTDPNAAKTLFGTGPSSGGRKSRPGHASYAYVADAPLPDAQVELRDGVGIDRYTGSAADNVLFNRQVLPAGTRVRLQIGWELPEEQCAFTHHIEALASLLAIEGLSVGAATTRGLGRLVVDGAVGLWQLDLRQLSHLQAWWQRRTNSEAPLPDDSRRTVDKPDPKDAPGADQAVDARRWSFRLHWRPVGPLLVKAAGDAPHADQMPLLGRYKGKWHPVLPGSSIKGAWRAHGERIVRTVTGMDVQSEQLVDQILELDNTMHGVVNDLFGRPRQRRQTGAARAALAPLDCHHLCGLAEHVLTEDPSGDGGYRRRTMVSIDRWTGGALDGALFTVLEPPWEHGDGRSTLWQPIEFSVDLTLLADAAACHRVMALLYLILADVQREEVPLGYGTNRGFGHIRTERIEAKCNGVAVADLDPANPSSFWRAVAGVWFGQWERDMQYSQQVAS